MSGNLVHINLLGTRFSIETDEKPEYLQTLIENLDRRLVLLEKSTGLHDPLKLALLSGILMEDELRKSVDLKKASEPAESKDSIEAERLTLHILKNIDKTLLD